MNKIVEISCFEHIYEDNTKVELCGIEFFVNKGEKVAILGPNGGGKTTLIKHILGLLTPSKGAVKVLGLNPSKDFDKLKKRIGVIFQSVDEQLIGPVVIDDVMFAPVNFGVDKKSAKKKAENIMEKLDILHLKDKIIHYLSGGEKTKVALAGALVLEPEILILDEPFSNLDMKSKKELIKLINQYANETQMSVIISTHEIELVSEFADTMYLISKNHISQKGTPEELLCQKETLEKFNLEEPSIVKLFRLLNQEGKNLELATDIEKAADILMNRII